MRQLGTPRTFRAASVSVLAALAFVAALLVAAFSGPAPAKAASAADFQAGNIISDEVFYNTSTMTAADIQAFIAAQEPSCSAGYTCLKSYTDTMGARGADKYCDAIGGGAMTAAQVIYTVSQACGINPEVIITTLEKEEVLISDTSPSSSQYRIAMGYACPDSAPCDTQYYGFANQVYSAAHQFQVYRLNPNSFNYRPGQNNYIQWNPNAACGGSTVYIQNSATASLYDYTPYQPNAAALANLYGTGDSCSAYGNRNFWRIFTDWFGDTHSAGSLVMTAGSPAVYLVVGTVKHQLTDASVLQTFAALGPYHQVSDTYLASLTLGNSLTNLVRDPSSGAIYYVDAGGARHQFSTCDQMSTLGFSCSDAVDLAAYQLSKLPLGPAMTLMVKSASSPVIYYVDGTTLRPVPDWPTAQALNGGADPYAYVPPDSFFSSRTVGQTVLAPATLVKYASSPVIYLVDGIGNKIPITSFGTAAELGIGGYSVQSDAVLNSYTTASSPLTIALSCAGAGYVAGGGAITSMPSVASTGIPVTSLDALTCAELRKTGTQLGQALFLDSAGNPAIYEVIGGALRHVPSIQALTALNGGAPAVAVTVSAETLGGFTQGTELLMPGSLVKTASSAQIYLVDGTSQRIPVSSFAISAELGINGYATQPDAVVNAYQATSSPLSLLVSCGNTYLAASGQLVQLLNPSGTGLAVTQLSSPTCSTLAVNPAVVPSPLFVKTASSSIVYYVSGGTAYPVNSMDDIAAISHGSIPPIPTMTAAGLATIPVGRTVVGPGQLFKSSSADDIWISDGLSRKYHVDSFSTVADLGLPTNYQVVPDSLVSGYSTGAGSTLHDVVSCNGAYLVGASGKVYALASGNDFSSFATAFDASTCARMPGAIAQPDSGGLFVKGSGPVIYQLLSGQKRPIASMDRLVQLAGNGSPHYEIMSDASLNAIPTGAAA